MKLQQLCTAVLGLAALATTAVAQDVDLFTVKTKVNPFCSAMSPGPTPSLNLGELAGADGRVVSAFVGPNVADLGSYYCNRAATATLSATPLLQTTTAVVDTDAFTNRVDYTATLNWDDVTQTASSQSASPTTFSTTEPNVGNLLVTVSQPTVAGNRRPIAGAYAGSVVLTLAVIP